MKKMTKVLALLLAAAMMLMCFAACGKDDASKTETAQTNNTTTESSDGTQTIKIAAFYNLSGSGAQVGEYDRHGAEMAVEDINEAGGIKALGGAKIELVFGDLMSDVNQAKAVAENVLGNGDISVCIGVASSAMAVPILGVTERLDTAFLLNGTSDTLTQEGYTTVFRFAPTGTAFGEAQVKFLKALNEDYGMDITKVGGLYYNTEGGISTNEGFKKYTAEAGMEWVYDETFTESGLTDASNLVVKMKESGVQAISLSAWEQDMKVIIEAMDTIGYHPMLLGGGAGVLNPTFADEMGEKVNGILSTASGNWDNKDASDPEIAKRFEEKFGYFMPEHSVGAYAAVQCAAAAIEAAASTNPSDIKTAMREMDIQTIDGRVSFDDKVDNIYAETNMIQWQKCDDGKYRPVSVYPASLAAGTIEYELVSQ